MLSVRVAPVAVQPFSLRPGTHGLAAVERTSLRQRIADYGDPERHTLERRFRGPDCDRRGNPGCCSIRSRTRAVSTTARLNGQSWTCRFGRLICGKQSRATDMLLAFQRPRDIDRCLAIQRHAVLNWPFAPGDDTEHCRSRCLSTVTGMQKRRPDLLVPEAQLARRQNGPIHVRRLRGCAPHRLRAGCSSRQYRPCGERSRICQAFSNDQQLDCKVAEPSGI